MTQAGEESGRVQHTSLSVHFISAHDLIQYRISPLRCQKVTECLEQIFIGFFAAQKPNC